MARLEPQNIDVAEVHDATSFCEIHQCEMLRFCSKGHPVGATVDFVAGNRAIFDIGGNKYRLVVKIDYAVGLVLVRFVGVHAAYDRIDATTI
jgi:mRNA-degrading endonuclease HigB of HigAB toxin-antitoxin module